MKIIITQYTQNKHIVPRAMNKTHEKHTTTIQMMQREEKKPHSMQ